MPLVEVELSDRIGTLTMRHNAKRNVLDRNMVSELLAALDHCVAQPARAVIIRASTGAKVWSAGHDVLELPQAGSEPLEWHDPLRTLVRRIETLPLPTIAAIEGSVWGGACEVVFACDIAVAERQSTFALTPARLGVPYNLAGLLTILNAIGQKLAKEMLFTGSAVSVTRIEQVGGVNHIVDTGDLEREALRIASEIAANAPLSIAAMKEQLRCLAGSRSLAPNTIERLQYVRRVAYTSRDYLEGLSAFCGKRKPDFTGE